MKRFFRVQSPARLISLSFAVVILLGSALLMLPCSVRDGVELKYIDSLYTSTSAVSLVFFVALYYDAIGNSEKALEYYKLNMEISKNPESVSANWVVKPRIAQLSK